MFMVQVAFDSHKDNRWKFIFLAPIGWLLFYISTFVEFMALIHVFWGHIRKKEITWQKWERKGVFSK